MQCKRLTSEEAWEQGQKLPFALLRQYSSVFFGRTPEKIEMEELIEARFFNQTQEIRIFRLQDTLCGVSLTKEETDRSITASYPIENRKLGVCFSVRHILNCDEDGQSYIEETCLTDWEGGIEDGQ